MRRFLEREIYGIASPKLCWQGILDVNPPLLPLQLISLASSHFGEVLRVELRLLRLLRLLLLLLLLLLTHYCHRWHSHFVFDLFARVFSL